MHTSCLHMCACKGALHVHSHVQSDIGCLLQDQGVGVDVLTECGVSVEKSKMEKWWIDFFIINLIYNKLCL